MKYLRVRLNTPIVEAEDVLLTRLSKLVYRRRNAADLEAAWNAERLLSARRGYADFHKMALAAVSEQTLKDSIEGYQHWMEVWATGGPVSDCGALEANPEHTANLINQVLKDREWFLKEWDLPQDTVLNPTQQRDLMNALSSEFYEQAGEKERDQLNRNRGCKDSEVRGKRRSRFTLEKQRRAGSSQVYELLLFTGRFDPVFLEAALEKIQKDAADDVEKQPPVDRRELLIVKQELRLGRKLQREVLQHRRQVRSFRDNENRLFNQIREGSLIDRVNELVQQLGRGRLRGDSAAEDVDIGRTQSGVSRFLEHTAEPRSIKRRRQ